MTTMTNTAPLDTCTYCTPESTCLQHTCPDCMTVHTPDTDCPVSL